MGKRLKIGAVLLNLTPVETQPPLQRFDSIFPCWSTAFIQLTEGAHFYIVAF